jgi:geranylgeranyl pyrophosphate synthase
MELIHMATLVHDDVIDESKTRRGVPTAASVFGNTAAILSGDVMLAKAMRILALDGDLEIIQRVSSVVVDLAEGETLELSYRGNLHLSKEDYFEVLRRKTATFIECCCAVGAMATKAEVSKRHALESFGLSIGMAFQIADDLLDYCGDSVTTGKPKLADFQEGCATLPLIEFMMKSDGQSKKEIEGYFGMPITELEGHKVYNLISQSGAFRSAEVEAMTFVSMAKKALEKLPASPEVDVLRSVSDFVVMRSK